MAIDKSNKICIYGKLTDSHVIFTEHKANVKPRNECCDGPQSTIKEQFKQDTTGLTTSS